MKLKRQTEMAARTRGRDQETERIVREIIAAVQRDGDAAVTRYTIQFDQRAPNADGNYEIAASDWEQRANLTCDRVTTALERAAKQIRHFHEKQIHSSSNSSNSSDNYQLDNGQTGLRTIPLGRVGLYVPGGTARYPSSVLMNGIPASVAGVANVVMVTPSASPEALRAAQLVGVDRVFEIGGAQAIAGLAIGTDSIPRVDKIVGPGNRFVAEAKRQVFGWVDIDSIAGPSEILIIADDSANPRWVAADLLAQAEHDALALPILVATSEDIVAAVEIELSRQLETLPRADIARAALSAGGAALVVASIEQAIAIAEDYAPEHLELMIVNASDHAKRICHAGAVFVGDYSPEAAGDYMAGPNHVLPTGGSARFASPLGVYDFVKRVSRIELSRDRLRELSPDIQALAAIEGLDAHGRSVAMRFETENDRTR